MLQIRYFKEETITAILNYLNLGQLYTFLMINVFVFFQKDGGCPLHFCTSIPMTSLLINSGADPNIRMMNSR